MPEREGRKFFFCLQTMLAVLFLISGVALTIEAAFGGYAIGLLFVAAMADGVLFFVLAALFAATAWPCGHEWPIDRSVLAMARCPGQRQLSRNVSPEPAVSWSAYPNLSKRPPRRRRGTV